MCIVYGRKLFHGSLTNKMLQIWNTQQKINNQSIQKYESANTLAVYNQLYFDS